jgi:hypothetical protein
MTPEEGVVEAKKVGATLTGVALQSAKYGEGLPDRLQAPVRPLPFLYESTGVVTRFTNGLDPEPRGRGVVAFHQPRTLAEWVSPAPIGAPTGGVGEERAGQRLLPEDRLQDDRGHAGGPAGVLPAGRGDGGHDRHRDGHQAAGDRALPAGGQGPQLRRAEEGARRAGGRMLADVVTLVRNAIRADDELAPYRERVEERYAAWLAGQQAGGRRFTAEQRQWLEAIKAHVAANLTIGRDDFDYVPFAQRGGLGKVYQLFGEELDGLLAELNEVLAA